MSAPRHVCAAIGCSASRASARPMCLRHWRLLPRRVARAAMNAAGLLAAIDVVARREGDTHAAP